MRTVGEIVLAAVLGLFVNEVSSVSPWLARRIVRWAAVIAYPEAERRSDRAEEWAAIIHDRPGKLLKLSTSIGFLFGAVLLRTRWQASHISTRMFRTAPQRLATLAIASGRRLTFYEGVLTVLILLRYRPAERWLARLYELQHRFEGALDLYRTSRFLRAGVGWLRMGTLLEMLGRIDEATLVYQQATVGEHGHLAKAELFRLIGTDGVHPNIMWYRPIPDAVLAADQATIANSNAQLSAYTYDISQRTEPSVATLLLGDDWDVRLYRALLLELDGRVDDAVAMCIQARQDVAARWRAYELLQRHHVLAVEGWALLHASFVPQIVNEPVPLAAQLIGKVRRRETRRTHDSIEFAEGPTEQVHW